MVFTSLAQAFVRRDWGFRKLGGGTGRRSGQLASLAEDESRGRRCCLIKAALAHVAAAAKDGSDGRHPEVRLALGGRSVGRVAYAGRGVTAQDRVAFCAGAVGAGARGEGRFVHRDAAGGIFIRAVFELPELMAVAGWGPGLVRAGVGLRRRKWGQMIRMARPAAAGLTFRGRRENREAAGRSFAGCRCRASGEFCRCFSLRCSSFFEAARFRVRGFCRSKRTMRWAGVEGALNNEADAELSKTLRSGGTGKVLPAFSGKLVTLRRG